MPESPEKLCNTEFMVGGGLHICNFHQVSLVVLSRPAQHQYTAQHLGGMAERLQA